MQRALLSLLYMKQTNRWLFDSLCLCNQHLANLRRLLGWKSCDFISAHSEAGGGDGWWWGRNYISNTCWVPQTQMKVCERIPATAVEKKKLEYWK